MGVKMNCFGPPQMFWMLLDRPPDQSENEGKRLDKDIPRFWRTKPTILEGDVKLSASRQCSTEPTNNKITFSKVVLTHTTCTHGYDSPPNQWQCLHFLPSNRGRIDKRNKVNQRKCHTAIKNHPDNMAPMLRYCPPKSIFSWFIVSRRFHFWKPFYFLGSAAWGRGTGGQEGNYFSSFDKYIKLTSIS